MQMEGGSVSINRMVVWGLAGVSAVRETSTRDGRAKTEVAWGPWGLVE